MKKIAIVWVLLIFSSCIPSPWKKEIYTNEMFEDLILLDEFPSLLKYEDYYVNGAFIGVYISAFNRDKYHSTAPYRIIIEALGEEFIHKRLLIESIEINSSSTNHYLLNNIDDFPLEFDFKPISYTNSDKNIKLSTVNYAIKQPFFFNFDDNEIITITIDISIESNNQIKSGELNYIFTPVLEKGLFQWVSR